MNRILIIIPAYNEEECILHTVSDIRKKCGNVDILVVNDASTDHTRELLRKYHVTHIDLPLNLGIGGSVQTGYLYAMEQGYDIAVQMDGDGQHPAEELRKVVFPIIAENADIAIGSRFVTKEGFQSSKLRRFGILILSSWIHLLTGLKVYDVTSGYRAVNKKFIEIYARDYAQDYPEPEAIVVAANYGARIAEMPVIMRERMGGNSTIDTWKSAYYMLKVFLSIIVRRLAKRRSK